MREQSRLGEILVQSGVIDEFQLSAALEEHRRSGHRLGLTLVRLGFLAEPDLVRGLAAQLQLPIVRLDGKRVDAEVLALVPREVAEKHNVLPLFLKDLGAGRELYLGMEDPSDVFAREEVASWAEMPVEPVIVAASELAVAIDRLYRSADEEPQLELEDALEDSRDGRSRPRVVSRSAASAIATAIDPGEVDTRVIVRALTQLLVEAGVVDRGVLLERIARLAREVGERGGPPRS